MKNKEIAKLFYLTSQYLSIQNIPFKPQAYERAAMALETLTEDVLDIYEKSGRKGLEQIPGVGARIAEQIEEYLRTGKIRNYEELHSKIPMDMEILTSIEGVGPKMVSLLYKSLGIKTLKDLEKAARSGRIRSLPHFGLKTEQNILEGIAFVKRSEGRWLLGDIYPYVEEIVRLLESSGLARQVVPAGSVRRMRETIGDIDILAT